MPWPKSESEAVMAIGAKRRARDPQATRADIIEAALSLLAKDGPEAISLSAVAVLAGVNRGTAYQHFETRENLVAATLEEVSQRMFRAVFGDPEAIGERDVEQVDMIETTRRMATFATENTDLCRIWLLQLLASPDPAADPFWREYAGSIQRFSQTALAKPGIDVEVWSVISLAGNFLWPVWARSHSQGEEEMQAQIERLTREMLRLSLHGTLDEAHNADVAAFLAADPAYLQPAPLRIVE